MQQMYTESELDNSLGYAVTSITWATQWTGYFKIEAHGKNVWVHDNEVIRV